MRILAKVENWHLVLSFLQKFTNGIGMDHKVKSEIFVSAEEIFVNVAKYAYPNTSGNILIKAEFDPSKECLYLKFEDNGIPFDPTKLRAPNTFQNAKERKIGGLGIFIVKKTVDEMKYCYKNGTNNLLIAKKIKCFRGNKNGN